MRVVFTSSAGLGHFHPTVPVARALQQAGHQVTYAVSPGFCKTVERSGFAAMPVGSDLDATLLSSRQTELELKGDHAAALEVLLDVFLGENTRARAKDLLAKLASNPPDLFIREGQELSGAMVAEKLGVPHVAVQVGGGDGPLPTLPPFIRRVNLLEEAVGLTPDPTLSRMYRYLNVANAPESFFEQLPPTTRYFRAPIFDASDPEPAPAWLDRLGERPVIFIGLGTSFFQGKMLTEIISGLRDEPFDLVVTTGKDYDGSILGKPAPNIHVAGYLRHSLILSKSTAAVLHGGYGTVLSAIDFAVPMVLVPFFADQPLNSERCAANGAALLLKPQTLTGAQVRTALHEVLEQRHYREGSRKLQQQWHAQPAISQVVPLLERIAREKRPVNAL